MISNLAFTICSKELLKKSFLHVFLSCPYRSTLAISTHVHQIINSFWKIHFNKWNIPKYPLLSFTIFFDSERNIFENFSISENKIISVQLAKVCHHSPNLLDGPFICFVLSIGTTHIFFGRILH